MISFRGSPLLRWERESRHTRFTHRQMSKRERRARRKTERKARRAGRK